MNSDREMGMHSKTRSGRFTFVLLLALVCGLAATSVAVAAEVTRYEENHPSIQYTGVWNVATTSLGSGGSYTWINSPGTATFTFTGTGVDWIGRTHYLFGYGEVQIDGGPWELVDLYRSPETPNAYPVVWSKRGLVNESHTVVIRWTGVQNPESTQGVYTGGLPPYNDAALVGIDAFDVFVEPEPVSVPASSTWGLALLAVAGLVGSAWMLRRRAQE